MAHPWGARWTQHVPAGFRSSGVSTVRAVQHIVQPPHARSGRTGPSSVASRSFSRCMGIGCLACDANARIPDKEYAIGNRPAASVGRAILLQLLLVLWRLWRDRDGSGATCGVNRAAGCVMARHSAGNADGNTARQGSGHMLEDNTARPTASVLSGGEMAAPGEWWSSAFRLPNTAQFRRWVSRSAVSQRTREILFGNIGIADKFS